MIKRLFFLFVDITLFKIKFFFNVMINCKLAQMHYGSNSIDIFNNDLNYTGVFEYYIGNDSLALEQNLKEDRLKMSVFHWTFLIPNAMVERQKDRELGENLNKRIPDIVHYIILIWHRFTIEQKCRYNADFKLPGLYSRKRRNIRKSRLSQGYWKSVWKIKKDLTGKIWNLFLLS